MHYADRFNYVYFHYNNKYEDKGKVFHSRWRRVHLSDIPKLLKKHKEAFDCFHSIQSYSSIDEMPGEEHLCPLFFDFDGEFEAAQEDARKTVAYFAQMGLEEPAIRVWFSGKKGFHVTIDATSLGIVPHEKLTLMVKMACMYVREQLELATFDPAVYSIKRQWRIPGTLHRGAGKYCTELRHAEVGLEKERILELAGNPQEPLFPEEEYWALEKVEVGAAWFSRFVKQYMDYEASSRLTDESILNVQPDCNQKHPACVVDLLEHGLRKGGTRNKATMILASYYKDQKIIQKDAEKELLAWAQGLSEFTSASENEKRLNTLSTVRSVYSDEKYHFHCNAIRDLGRATSMPIECVGEETCPFINRAAYNKRRTIPITIAQSADAQLLGKKITFTATVLGRDKSVFGVPLRGRTFCTPMLTNSNALCHHCKIAPAAAQGPVSFHISPQDEACIMFPRSSKIEHATEIKRHLRIPFRCKKVSVKVDELVNMYEVLLGQPTTTSFKDTTAKTGYAERNAFIFGHEIEDGHTYQMTGYVFPSTRNAEMVNVIESSEPVQMQLDSFKMSSDLSEDLEVFQGSPETQFKKIHDELEHHVVCVWGRQDMMTAFDLAYHSVLSFYFQGEFIDRGWVQVVVAGDTNQGKSKMQSRMMEHYNAGTYISGESATQAGLLYGVDKTAYRGHFIKWGALARNDRMLVTVDELQRLNEEIVSNMGTVREKGLLTPTKIVYGSRLARVRMILLANPPDRNETVSQQSFGVEVLKSLFAYQKDLRRCDMGMVLNQNEIPLDKINRVFEHPGPPKTFTSDRCSKLIQWAWSRKAKQVIISPETRTLILERATDMTNRYYANSFVLVHPGDFRIKLARLAAACAARVFSTEDGENLLVKDEHVDFVADWLDVIYSGKEMDMQIFIQEEQKKELLTPKTQNAFVAFLRQFSIADDPEPWKSPLRVMLTRNRFKVQDIRDSWRLGEHKSNMLIKRMTELNLLQADNFGIYRLTPIGIQLFKKLDLTDKNEFFDGGEAPDF